MFYSSRQGKVPFRYAEAIALRAEDMFNKVEDVLRKVEDVFRRAEDVLRARNTASGWLNYPFVNRGDFTMCRKELSIWRNKYLRQGNKLSAWLIGFEAATKRYEEQVRVSQLLF